MKQILIMVGSMLALAILFLSCIMLGNKLAQLTGETGRWYDCRLAEISPDYPIDVKNECRNRAKK